MSVSYAMDQLAMIAMNAFLMRHILVQMDVRVPLASLEQTVQIIREVVPKPVTDVLGHIPTNVRSA